MLVLSEIIFTLDKITQNIWLIWIIVGVILLIAEIFTEGFVVSLLGLAAVLAGLTAIFFNYLWLQLGVFSAASILMVIFLRPVFLKYFTGPSLKKSNVDALSGKEVLVETEIDNLKGTGYVKDGGDFWRAKSIDGDVIAKGKVVIIDRVEGNTAFVRLDNIIEESEGEE